MKRLCAVLGLVIAFAVPLDAARGADAVKVRAAEHPHYGRIAFDWPAPVAYDAKVDGGTLTIHFERGLEASLGTITENIGSYVESVSLGADGTTLTARLKRPVTLKTFTEGNTIAIDLVEAATATVPKAARQTDAAKAPAAQAGSAPPKQPIASAPTPSSGADKTAVAIRSGEHEGYHRLVLEWKRAYTLSEDKGGVH